MGHTKSPGAWESLAVRIVIITLTLAVHSLGGSAEDPIQDQHYWYEAAREALEKRQQPGGAGARARSVVLFVGDGMGLATLTAARILKGQRAGRPGEEGDLVWDTFPAVALSKTYNADAQIGESSACATALMCGVKANYETLGVDSGVKFGECVNSYRGKVPSLLTWAQEEGKATGIVTNTRVTHATPAALYAHASSRFWEDDSKVDVRSRAACKDIARQLIEDEPGRNIKVILGGGRRHFTSVATLDPEPPHKEGKRLDGRNLIEDWLREKHRAGQTATYVTTQEELSAVDTGETEFLLGLFAGSHMEFESERDEGPTGDPSLPDMTARALDMLMKSEDGFFLMVEGGRIDHAHHFNNAFRALDETLSLEQAVNMTLGRVNLTNTLVLVTADHSHVMVLGGYATSRGNSIFGFDRKPSDIDQRPYTTLLYSNGPGGIPAPKRKTRGERHKDTIQRAAVPRGWATHAGEDVPVYAIGPSATQLFSGTIDQTYIPHAIARGACMGPYKDSCNAAAFPEIKKEFHVSNVKKSENQSFYLSSKQKDKSVVYSADRKTFFNKGIRFCIYKYMIMIVVIISMSQMLF